MAKKPSKTIGFEKALNELEQLVEKLEQGEMTLEESLKAFERGVTLTHQCEATLREAEQKIEVLTTNSTDAPLETYKPESLPDTDDI